MASATAIPNRRNSHGRGVAEIYIGGAADGQSQLVVSYVKARQRALLEGGAGVGRSATWFAHYDMDGVLEHCRAALSQGDELVLVGHSWGSDAALRVSHQLHVDVALLAGVDPVMRPGGIFSSVTQRPDNAGLVAHVDARPRAFDRSDIVKATGVVLGGGLARAWREADVTISTELNHWAFAHMMAAPGSDGVSLQARINEAGWRAAANRAG